MKLAHLVPGKLYQVKPVNPPWIWARRHKEPQFPRDKPVALISGTVFCLLAVTVTPNHIDEEEIVELVTADGFHGFVKFTKYNISDADLFERIV